MTEDEKWEIIVAITQRTGGIKYEPNKCVCCQGIKPRPLLDDPNLICGIPFAVLVCDNCGHAEHFSLEALGLTHLVNKVVVNFFPVVNNEDKTDG